jgi:5-methylcytosine-specific restriction endonuclease McrA
MDTVGVGSILYPAYCADGDYNEHGINELIVKIISETKRSWLALKSDGITFKIPKNKSLSPRWLTQDVFDQRVRANKLKKKILDLLNDMPIDLEDREAELLSIIKIIRGKAIFSDCEVDKDYEKQIHTARFRNAMRLAYESYQRSDKWKNVVIMVCDRDRLICQDCKGQMPSGVCHHKSYDNWGKGNTEEIDDCIWLCRNCHTKRHAQHLDQEPPFWAKRAYQDFWLSEEERRAIYSHEL